VVPTAAEKPASRAPNARQRHDQDQPRTPGIRSRQSIDGSVTWQIPPSWRRPWTIRDSSTRRPGWTWPTCGPGTKPLSRGAASRGQRSPASRQPLVISMGIGLFGGLRPRGPTRALRDALARVTPDSINIHKVLGSRENAGAPAITRLYTVFPEPRSSRGRQRGEGRSINVSNWRARKPTNEPARRCARQALARIEGPCNPFVCPGNRAVSRAFLALHQSARGEKAICIDLEVPTYERL
jgi:hypothetical protein